MSERWFNWDFILGEMKYFQFHLWSINCLHEIRRNETHCEIFFNCGHFDRNEISIWMIKCYANTTLKWNHTNRNECKENVLFELLLWRSTSNHNCFEPRKQNIYLNQFFQLKVTTKNFWIKIYNDTCDKRYNLHANEAVLDGHDFSTSFFHDFFHIFLWFFNLVPNSMHKNV